MNKNHTITDFISSNPPSREKGDGSRLYTCPFCGGINKLEISPFKGVWFCHKEQIGGRVDAESPGLFGEALIPDHDLLIEYRRSAVGSVQWDYLRSRGLSDQIIHRDIKPFTGPDIHYVYLPVFGLGGGRPLLFIGRGLTKETRPRFRTSSMLEGAERKSECIWGLHRIRGRVKEITICEGILSAVWYDNALAILGKVMSAAQAKLVVFLQPDEVTVMLDGGTAMERPTSTAATFQVADRIYRAGFKGKIFRRSLITGMDPDDYAVEKKALPEKERLL
jgi:hypothetical protein